VRKPLKKGKEEKVIWVSEFTKYRDPKSRMGFVGSDAREINNKETNLKAK